MKSCVVQQRDEFFFLLFSPWGLSSDDDTALFSLSSPCFLSLHLFQEKKEEARASFSSLRKKRRAESATLTRAALIVTLFNSKKKT